MPTEYAIIIDLYFFAFNYVDLIFTKLFSGVILNIPEGATLLINETRLNQGSRLPTFTSIWDV
jgi:hypothetical protein